MWPSETTLLYMLGGGGGVLSKPVHQNMSREEELFFLITMKRDMKIEDTNK